MTSVEEAKQFAEAHFPEGPEKLAEKLGVEVREEVIKGCDGWVLSGPGGIIIRLNQNLSSVRRRFTLAHELGHLLLGIPTVVGETNYDSLKSNNAEEHRVNDLASELLLPESVVKRYFPKPPVVAAGLARVAKRANISEVAAAIRVANLAPSIGFSHASVAFFHHGKFAWQWSKALTLTKEQAVSLLAAAHSQPRNVARVPQPETDHVMVTSILENPGFSSVTMFVQLLPAAIANQASADERRIEIEHYLFHDDDQFRLELQGSLGYFRTRCQQLTIDAAIAEFCQNKADRWQGPAGNKFHSPEGREYIRLRLAEWCD